MVLQELKGWFRPRWRCNDAEVKSYIVVLITKNGFALEKPSSSFYLPSPVSLGVTSHFFPLPPPPASLSTPLYKFQPEYFLFNVYLLLNERTANNGG